MTNATVLVEALVQAGILRLGKNNMWYVGPHDRPSPPLYRNGDTALDLIVTDWRVAGKVMESIDQLNYDNLLKKIVIANLGGNQNGHVVEIKDSLPRAIIEAWYSELEHCSVASDTERHGLGTYSDGAVKLGYRSGSSSQEPDND